MCIPLQYAHGFLVAVWGKLSPQPQLRLRQARRGVVAGAVTQGRDGCCGPFEEGML